MHYTIRYDNLIMVFGFLLLLIACQNNKNKPNEISNKDLSLQDKISINPEIEKALNHYSYAEDSLKRKAMRFLIDNMDFKEGLSTNIVKKYTPIYEYILRNGKTNGVENENIEVPSELYSQAVKFDGLYITDINKITASLLIENVEYAFKAWHLPWSKNYSFSTFCQYILPYRTLDEPLTKWRKYLYEKQSDLIDELKQKQITDPVKICKILSDTLLNRYIFYADINAPYLPIEKLYNKPAGNCKQRYLLYTSMAKALGLPVTIDFVTQYPRYPGSHSWTVLVEDKNGEILAFNGGDKWEEFPFKSIKIYRNTFKNFDRTTGNNVPPLFTRSNCIDVTKEYPGKVIDFKIDLDSTIDDQKVYLYTFGTGPELKAMAKGKIEEGKAIYNDVLYTEEALVLPLIYQDGKQQILKNPILMTQERHSKTFNPIFNDSQRITLQRKYPLNFEMVNFAKHIVGAKIQGANTRDFQDSVTIFEFKEFPPFYQQIIIDHPDRYKYYRYLPKKNIHLAELNFYVCNNDSAQCTTLDSNYYFVPTPSLNFNTVCDHSIRTNFNSETTQWIGVEMSKDFELCKVGILPRNNWNVIEDGHKYELFYFDKGWHSLAMKEANGFDITFDKVPDRAVLLLRNLTGGTQERIFTYRDNWQIFW